MKLDRIRRSLLADTTCKRISKFSSERDGFSWWGTEVGEKRITWSPGAAGSHPITSYSVTVSRKCKP